MIKRILSLISALTIVVSVSSAAVAGSNGQHITYWYRMTSIQPGHPAWASTIGDNQNGQYLGRTTVFRYCGSSPCITTNYNDWWVGDVVIQWYRSDNTFITSSH